MKSWASSQQLSFKNPSEMCKSVPVTSFLKMETQGHD